MSALLLKGITSRTGSFSSSSSSSLSRLCMNNGVRAASTSMLHHHHTLLVSKRSTSLPSSSMINGGHHQHQHTRSLATDSSSGAGDTFVMNVPTMGDSITEGTVVNWLKNVGDLVKDDEAFVVVETDKVSVDLTATKGGIIVETFAKKGDTIRVGTPLVKFQRGGGAGAAGASSGEVKKEAPAAAAAPVSAPAPPAAAAPTPAPTPAAAAPPPPPKPASAAAPPAKKVVEAPKSSPIIPGSRIDRKVKMTRIRQRIAERLVQSQATTARLTTFNEIDMSKLMEMRGKYKDAFQEKYGQKLGFMSAFVIASAKTLQEIPTVNASIEGEDVVYHDYIDMSIAVSGPRGLVVPVLRNVETMNFAQVEAGIAAFAEKAKNDTLTLEEMSGGTFTITNGGVFGSWLSTPMINLPQSAILGMHNIVKRPVVITNENKKDEIVIRPIMGVALSYDHRLIDGRESVTFLKSVKDKLEDPVRMLIGM